MDVHHTTMDVHAASLGTKQKRWGKGTFYSVYSLTRFRLLNFFNVIIDYPTGNKQNLFIRFSLHLLDHQQFVFFILRGRFHIITITSKTKLDVHKYRQKTAIIRGLEPITGLIHTLKLSITPHHMSCSTLSYFCHSWVHAVILILSWHHNLMFYLDP